MDNLTKQWQKEVLAWYHRNGRDLPWRRTDDPYQIMVSEIMLQQTQADRVVPKYHQWLEQFPNIQSLATAKAAEVIRLWAGLGYNRRALYLQKAAQAINEIGYFPKTIEALRKLPGIGPYTAAAIASFADNADVALIDTNIKRIYQLLKFGEIEPTNKELEAIATQYLPLGRSRDWHNALMDIGSLISKEKGGRAQQQKLLLLFPVLKSFNLPTLSDSPLHRPKQSNFKHSRRYWRGKIIHHLREHNQVTVKQIAEFLIDSPYPLEELLEGLAKDQLIERKEDKISLPL